MAENTNTIYIPYGLEEIDLTALNEALANGYLNYLNSRVWTKGKKGQARAKLWMDAYNKVLLQGITGASVVDGQWKINHNGQEFTYADPKELEIYEDFAGFVLDEMKKLPTRKSKEEEKKEDKKDKYDFRSNFQQDFLNRYYGNNPDLYRAEWFELDPRGEKGIRGTEKRRERLIEALTKYRDESLKDNYDYEGTPFTGYDDVKSRITEAINALQSPNANDDLPALNKLGLDYRSMMYNGANDVYGKDSEGNPVTYLQYYDNLDKIAKQEAEAKATASKKAAETARANYWDGSKSYDFSKFNGRPLKKEESNIEYLSNLFAKNKWSGDEASLIVQAFKLAELNGKLVPLSKEELSKLNPSTWKNRAKYLRKIDGVDGLYYDTYSRLYKKFYKNGQTSQTSFLDILDLNNPEAIAKKKADSDLKLREQYAKRTEMTPQDWEYVASIVPDIASIPDTEPISAAALAFTGAGMRHHALANRPEGMSASDKWWLAADYLGAGLAAIPGFGDAYLVGRILNTTRKFATGLFAAAGAYGLGSATVNAFGKWAKGEDMTLQEKMDVVMAIPSLVSAYRLRSREGLNDAAKAANLNNITTNKGKIKVTVTDESGNKSIKEITGLSEQKSKELLKQFKNAGNDNSKKTQILKSDSEVQTRASELGIDLNKVSIETDSRHAASYRKPTEIEFYPETSPSSARTRYNQEIENLKNSGHNWQARRLLIYDKFYKGTGGAKKLSDGNWFKKAWHYVTDTPNLELANRIKGWLKQGGRLDKQKIQKYKEFIKK